MGEVDCGNRAAGNVGKSPMECGRFTNFPIQVDHAYVGYDPTTCRLGHATSGRRRDGALDRLGHRAGRGEAILGVALERAKKNVVERRRAGFVTARGLGRRAQDLDEELRRLARIAEA